MLKAFYKVETFASRRSVGYLTRRLHNLMMPLIEARFAEADLTFTHWVALMGLHDGLSRTCADIARHLGHDSGATTRLVDQLEARGFVTRKRSKTDRRAVELALTPRGRAITRSLMPRVIDFWNEMLDGFSANEAAVLIDMLTRLVARLEREASRDGAAPKARIAR